MRTEKLLLLRHGASRKEDAPRPEITRRAAGTWGKGWVYRIRKKAPWANVVHLFTGHRVRKVCSRSLKSFEQNAGGKLRGRVQTCSSARRIEKGWGGKCEGWKDADWGAGKSSAEPNQGPRGKPARGKLGGKSPRHLERAGGWLSLHGIPLNAGKSMKCNPVVT